jgi:hypothetical protein
MRTLILLILLSISFSSCSKDDNNCQEKRTEITEKYNKLIELAEGDDAQQATLIRNRDVQLEKLGC